MNDKFFDTDRRFSWGFAVILIIAFVLFVCSQMHGETTPDGRPDPTGKGRYMQFGKERAYTDARVVKQLPAGAQCAPAGELVGVQMWNSTRDGHAILSELSDKAEVAASDGKIFLCHCARGYNELFLVEESPKRQSSDKTTKMLAQAPVIVNVYNDSSAETTAPASQNVATGGMPAAAVYEFDQCGNATATISMGIRVALVVPFCPLVVGGGYYPPGYRDHGYEHHREYRGGGGRPQPPPSRPVRPVRPNPTPTPTQCVGTTCVDTGTVKSRHAPSTQQATTQRNSVVAPRATSRVATAARSVGSSSARGYSGGGRSGGGHR